MLGSEVMRTGTYYAEVVPVRGSVTVGVSRPTFDPDGDVIWATDTSDGWGYHCGLSEVSYCGASNIWTRKYVCLLGSKSHFLCT